MRRTAFLVLGGLLIVRGPTGFAAQLQPKTSRAYEQYVRATEARMKLDAGRPGHFLYIDSLTASEHEQVLAALKQGEIYVTALTTRDQNGNPIGAPGGWIHHWLAAVYVPGGNLTEAIEVGQDYNKYASYYKPELVRCHVLSRTNNTFKVYSRLEEKTPWVTITLDTYSDVRYVFLDRRFYTVSHFFRIQQVEDAGQPDEHLDPPGDGSGFLWGMDVYWRYEAVPGGILVESETIALTRGLPFGLGWILGPFIHRASLATARQLMVRTRQIIEQAGTKTLHSSNRGLQPGGRDLKPHS